LMHELRGAPEPTLEEQLRLLEPCDLVLIEGYKAAAVPKIEIHRPSHGKPPLWPENEHVVAVATDADNDADLDCPLPRLPLNEPAAIADFILDYLKTRWTPTCFPSTKPTRNCSASSARYARSSRWTRCSPPAACSPWRSTPRSTSHRWTTRAWTATRCARPTCPPPAPACR